MRGVAILTEVRSGSNWLGSLTNATGLMGRSEEWLNRGYLGIDPDGYDALEAAVLQKASTPNGRFAIKVFPSHLAWAKEKSGKDFLFEIRKTHDLSFVLLERRDRTRQAISAYRASISRVWTSKHRATRGPARYSFAGISQAFFEIERSYAFWRAYLSLSDLSCQSFVYEDLQQDPKPYLEALARFMQVPVPATTPLSELEVQRDVVTEQWVARFREDVEAKGAIDAIEDAPLPRTLDNLTRFAFKKPLARKRF